MGWRFSRCENQRRAERCKKVPATEGFGPSCAPLLRGPSSRSARTPTSTGPAAPKGASHARLGHRTRNRCFETYGPPALGLSRRQLAVFHFTNDNEKPRFESQAIGKWNVATSIRSRGGCFPTREWLFLTQEPWFTTEESRSLTGESWFPARDERSVTEELGFLTAESRFPSREERSFSREFKFLTAESKFLSQRARFPSEEFQFPANGARSQRRAAGSSSSRRSSSGCLPCSAKPA